MIKEQLPSFTDTDLKRWFGAMNNLKVMVVGDVMIDAYYWGKVDRISPEAPVPVVHITEKENRLGGAANVALNVMSLEATPIICSVIGNDDKADLFAGLLEKRGFSDAGIVRSDERFTTTKTRVISDGQHLLRVDEESTNALTSAEEEALISRCKVLMKTEKVDVLIFEDYNKGVLTEKVIQELITEAKANNIPVTVDPKKENFNAYTGVTLFKPNFKELVEGVKADLDKNDNLGLEEAVNQMESVLKNDISLVTLSERGVLVKSGNVLTLLPAHPRKILDVSGAGDTVISVASLLLALKASPEAIAALANMAGGLVCEKVGVIPIDKSILREEAGKWSS